MKETHAHNHSESARKTANYATPAPLPPA